MSENNTVQIPGATIAQRRRGYWNHSIVADGWTRAPTTSLTHMSWLLVHAREDDGIGEAERVIERQHTLGIPERHPNAVLVVQPVPL